MQTGNCFSVRPVSIKPLGKLFVPSERARGSFPTDVPEKETPATRLVFCNLFQGPERPGRSGSCILHTSGCVKCRKLVSVQITLLERSQSWAGDAGVGFKHKAGLVQSRRLKRVAQSHLTVGHTQRVSKKMYCCRKSNSPGKKLTIHLEVQRNLWPRVAMALLVGQGKWVLFEWQLSQTVLSIFARVKQISRFSPYPSNGLDLRHQEIARCPPGRSYPGKRRCLINDL